MPEVIKSIELDTGPVQWLNVRRRWDGLRYWYRAEILFRPTQKGRDEPALELTETWTEEGAFTAGREVARHVACIVTEY